MDSNRDGTTYVFIILMTVVSGVGVQMQFTEALARVGSSG